ERGPAFLRRDGLLTSGLRLLTSGFRICAESATSAHQPCALASISPSRPLRRVRTWLWLLLRIHAWDRLSVANATTTHTEKCGRVSTNRRATGTECLTLEVKQ